jgi:hypothetical protein
LHCEPGLFLNYWSHSLFSFSFIFILETLSFILFLLKGRPLSLRTGTAPCDGCLNQEDHRVLSRPDQEGAR